MNDLKNVDPMIAVVPKILVLPNGFLPMKEDPDVQRDGDVGTNLSVRAVVAIESKDEQKNREVPYTRKTLFDFMSPAKPEIKVRNLPEPNKPREYILNPMESVSLGLGVVVEIPRGHAGFVVPRSGTTKKHNRGCVLSVLNDHVPIDPGFRAEIWAELYNHGPYLFRIVQHMVLFQLLVIPINVLKPIIVNDFSELSESERGGMSNGHTDELMRKVNIAAY